MNFIIPDESDPENDSHETKSKEEVRESAERRAAEMRTQMAQTQGVFALEGEDLHCIIKGVQKKETTGQKKTPFLLVTFNGRLPNGANFASCFDKDLWEPLDKALDKECKLKVQMKDKFANITDVTWVEGIGA